MRILHYSLGFPPYRTGGMTKYCVDLMKQELMTGKKVALLWPGQIKLFNKETRIRKHRKYEGIDSFEIMNPLPISYDEGIREISIFMKECICDAYAVFFDEYLPDVIHVHTLMGLHEAFFIEAKKRKIRIVYTVHDFFPICPKVTLFSNGTSCEYAKSCLYCKSCNQTALSNRKMYMLQSPVYRFMKDQVIIKKLRSIHRNRFFSGQLEHNLLSAYEDGKQDYIKLRRFYEKMISYADIVHYNSLLTKRVFEEFYTPKKSVILSISHLDIQDHRKIKTFEAPIRITYLGPQSEAKGYFFLKEVLDQIWNGRKDFCLNIYFQPLENAPYMRIHNRYNYSELEKIFNETDILIVPSLWNETFGYTVLEALSFGVPVIVSSKVGAQDIIPVGGGIIFDIADKACVIKEIDKLENGLLAKMNQAICQNFNIITMEKVENAIWEYCYKRT